MNAACDAAHREAQDALPWLANGSLSGAELERVQAHLQDCAHCRADLALLHTLRAASPGPAPDCDPERALARLLPQLDAAAPPPLPEPVRGWRARLAANDRSWLRAAVALQFGAIAVLAALLARPFAPDAQPGAYRALGAAPVAHAALIVAFRQDTPERELRRILDASHARIVGGPTVTGAWLVDVDAGTKAALARLRSEPAVTLAEPLGAEGQP